MPDTDRRDTRAPGRRTTDAPSGPTAADRIVIDEACAALSHIEDYVDDNENWWPTAWAIIKQHVPTRLVMEVDAIPIRREMRKAATNA